MKNSDFDNLFQELTTFRNYYNYLLNFKNLNTFNIRDLFDFSRDQYNRDLHNTLDFSYFNISCQLSIDFATIFISSAIHSSSVVEKIINNNFQTVFKGRRYSEGVNSTVTIGAHRYSVFYKLKFINGYYKGILIKISHPDMLIIQHLQSLFGQDYNLSEVEYTADLYCNDPLLLFKIVSYTIMQERARVGVSVVYDKTYYPSNPRTAFSYGSREYLKTINNSQAVRIETIAKSEFFKQIKIKTLEDAVNLHPSVAFKRTHFKIFYLRSFLNKYLMINDMQPGLDIQTARQFESRFFEYFTRKHQGGGLLAVKKYIQSLTNRNDGNYDFDTYPFENYFNYILSNDNFI